MTLTELKEFHRGERKDTAGSWPTHFQLHGEALACLDAVEIELNQLRKWLEWILNQTVYSQPLYNLASNDRVGSTVSITLVLHSVGPWSPESLLKAIDAEIERREQP
jgi:hypothetical protein